MNLRKMSIVNYGGDSWKGVDQNEIVARIWHFWLFAARTAGQEAFDYVEPLYAYIIGRHGSFLFLNSVSHYQRRCQIQSTCVIYKLFLFRFLPLLMPAGLEDSINLNTLRTFRVLRPLKLVSGVPSKLHTYLFLLPTYRITKIWLSLPSDLFLMN